VAFNAQQVDRSSSLPPLVGAANIAEVANVKVIRNKRIKIIKVKLENLPEDEQALAGVEVQPTVDTILGMLVVDLTKDLREKLQVSKYGVLVKSVNDGVASKAGIRAGDVVIQIDGNDVNDAKHFKKLVNNLPKGKFVSLLINRQGTPIFLALKK